MGILERLYQQPLLLQGLQYRPVGLLYEGALPGRAGHELAVGAHQLHKGQVVCVADAGVVLAERGRDVDYSGALGEGNVAVGHHVEGALALGIGAVKQRLVLHAHQLRALVGGYRLYLVLAHHRLYQLAGHYAYAAVPLELQVVLLGVYAQRDVGGQGPGGRGPGHQVLILTLYLEAHEGGGVLHVLVALRDLMRAERGAAARAVGHYLVALVEQALFVHLLERPPHGLDVLVVIGYVGVLHVRPVAYAVAHLLPLVQVLPHGFLALLDEGLYAVALYLLFAVQAELLFYLQLHRQAVGIPAGLAQHLVALHGAIARYHVLHHAGEYVPDVGLAVGRGRAVIEREYVAALALVYRALEHVALFPELRHFLFALHEVQICGDLLKHSLPPLLLAMPPSQCPPDRKKALRPNQMGRKAFAVPPKLTP